jgi:hypothetical protein
MLYQVCGTISRSCSSCWWWMNPVSRCVRKRNSPLNPRQMVSAPLLKNGSILVSAAKQRNGHFYVKTKDVTVSVVGTVFIVKAEQEGSRVAVIEGEVHVQKGATTERLSPGEHCHIARTETKSRRRVIVARITSLLLVAQRCG